MSKVQLVEESDFWLIPLAERKVSRYFVDNNLIIELGFTDNPISISIGGAFTLLYNKVTYSLSAENLSEISPVFMTFHKSVTFARAYKQGKLELHFEEGNRLVVEVDNDYEAWQLYDENDLRLVCIPGGSLAIWR